MRRRCWKDVPTRHKAQLPAMIMVFMNRKNGCVLLTAAMMLAFACLLYAPNVINSSKLIIAADLLHCFFFTFLSLILRPHRPHIKLASRPLGERIKKSLNCELWVADGQMEK